MSRTKPAFGSPERIAACRRHRPIPQITLSTGKPNGRLGCWFCGAASVTTDSQDGARECADCGRFQIVSWGNWYTVNRAAFPDALRREATDSAERGHISIRSQPDRGSGMSRQEPYHQEGGG